MHDLWFMSGSVLLLVRSEFIDVPSWSNINEFGTLLGVCCNIR